MSRVKILFIALCCFVSNLGIQAKCTDNFPAGCMVDFAGDVAPRGWLLCNGEVYSNQKYPELFDTIETKFISNRKSWIIEANKAALNEKLFCVPEQVGKIISIGKINNVQEPNFTLSFSTGLSVEQVVQESINYYATVSNWIWHAVIAGNSQCDYRSITFKSLDIIESNIKLFILENLNSGKFLDALSTVSVFDKLTMNVSSSYTWGETKTHIRLIIPKLEKYIKEQSYNFFTMLLQINQFSKAHSLATAYHAMDETLSNEWVLTVEKKIKYQ